jgi:hypothetical protein
MDLLVKDLDKEMTALVAAALVVVVVAAVAGQPTPLSVKDGGALRTHPVRLFEDLSDPSSEERELTASR